MPVVTAAAIRYVFGDSPIVVFISARGSIIRPHIVTASLTVWQRNGTQPAIMRGSVTANPEPVEATRAPPLKSLCSWMRIAC